MKGYKTLVFFGLVFVVELANLLGFGDFKMSPEQQELLGLVVPLIGLALRYFTTTPILTDEQPVG